MEGLWAFIRSLCDFTRSYRVVYVVSQGHIGFIARSVGAWKFLVDP